MSSRVTGKILVLVVVVVSLQLTLAAEGVQGEAKAVDLIARLRTLTAAGPAREVEEEQQIAKQLSAFGDAIVPLIMKELQEDITTDNINFQLRLTTILADIRGVGATRALLELELYRRTKDTTFNAVVRGSLARQKIECVLSDEELHTLIADSKKREPGDLLLALDTVMILSQCVKVDATVRLTAAKELLIDVLELSTPASCAPLGLTGESRATIARGVMYAAANAGADGWPFWRSALNDSESQKESLWLAAALGMARDNSVAAKLRDAIPAEEDVWLRSILVMAYARSAQEVAMPYLEELQKDQASFGTRHGYPLRPVADAARQELLKLKKQKRGKN